MTTQPKTNGNLEDLYDLPGAIERWTDATRKVTSDSLDLYEKAVDQLADAEVKAARAVKLPALVTIAETHAAISRDVAGAYVSSVRGLLKA